MSLLLFALVIVGATPEGHLKLPGHVTALGVPSAVKISTKFTNLPDTVEMLVMLKLVMF